MPNKKGAQPKWKRQRSNPTPPEPVAVKLEPKPPVDPPKAAETTDKPVRKRFEMCKSWKEKKECRYGDRCLFAHGEEELSRGEPKQPPKRETPLKVKEDQTIQWTYIEYLNNPE